MSTSQIDRIYSNLFSAASNHWRSKKEPKLICRCSRFSRKRPSYAWLNIMMMLGEGGSAGVRLLPDLLLLSSGAAVTDRNGLWCRFWPWGCRAEWAAIGSRQSSVADEAAPTPMQSLTPPSRSSSKPWEIELVSSFSHEDGDQTRPRVRLFSLQH